MRWLIVSVALETVHKSPSTFKMDLKLEERTFRYLFSMVFESGDKEVNQSEYYYKDSIVLKKEKSLHCLLLVEA